MEPAPCGLYEVLGVDRLRRRKVRRGTKRWNNGLAALNQLYYAVQRRLSAFPITFLSRRFTKTEEHVPVFGMKLLDSSERLVYVMRGF